MRLHVEENDEGRSESNLKFDNASLSADAQSPRSLNIAMKVKQKNRREDARIMEIMPFYYVQRRHWFAAKRESAIRLPLSN